VIAWKAFYGWQPYYAAGVVDLRTLNDLPGGFFFYTSNLFYLTKIISVAYTTSGWPEGLDISNATPADIVYTTYNLYVKITANQYTGKLTFEWGATDAPALAQWQGLPGILEGFNGYTASNGDADNGWTATSDAFEYHTTGVITTYNTGQPVATKFRQVEIVVQLGDMITAQSYHSILLGMCDNMVMPDQASADYSFPEVFSNDAVTTPPPAGWVDSWPTGKLLLDALPPNYIAWIRWNESPHNNQDGNSTSNLNFGIFKWFNSLSEWINPDPQSDQAAVINWTDSPRLQITLGGGYRDPSSPADCGNIFSQYDNLQGRCVTRIDSLVPLARVLNYRGEYVMSQDPVLTAPGQYIFGSNNVKYPVKIRADGTHYVDIAPPQDVFINAIQRNDYTITQPTTATPP
jgi:hypothetical protein